MRIGRQAAAGGELAAEVLEFLVVEPAFEESAGVDAGRGVALEVDLIAAAGDGRGRWKKWLKPIS